MTTRRPTTAIIPAEEDDEPLITPAERRGHEHWPEETRHLASALLLQGQSVRAAARQLGVPRATLQAWKLSDDPDARAVHRERLLRMINLSYEVAETMLEKVRHAPVPTAQHAAVSAAVLIEKAQLLERSHEGARDFDKATPATAMDIMPMLRRAKEEGAREERERAEREKATLKAKILPSTAGTPH